MNKTFVAIFNHSNQSKAISRSFNSFKKLDHLFISLFDLRELISALKALIFPTFSALPGFFASSSEKLISTSLSLILIYSKNDF